MRVNRRRILQSLGLLTATGVAGCSGQSDSAPPRDDDASDTGDRAREIERKATNRAAMYGYFRETFSREYTYDKLVSQALTPLGTLLETMEITDRMGDDPPAVAAAVAIAPLPDPIDALSEAKDTIVGQHYSAADAILIQRENPALPVSDECSDALSEPRTEQGGSESRKLW